MKLETLFILSLLPFSAMALDMNIYVNSDENVTMNELLVTNDSIVGNYDLLANGSIEIWINGVNWTNIPSYISSHEYGWSHSGLSRQAVVKMFKNADLWRFYGYKTVSENKELAYWLEDYIGNIYHIFIRPEIYQEIGQHVETLEKETAENISQLNTTIAQIEEDQDSQDIRIKNTYQLAYRWTKANEKKIRENQEKISEVYFTAKKNEELTDFLIQKNVYLGKRVGELEGELKKTKMILEGLIIMALLAVIAYATYRVWKEANHKFEEVASKVG